MEDDTPTTPSSDDDIHRQFMQQLMDNIQAQIGKDKMISMVGDPSNGIYGVMISVKPFHPDLVMMTILNLISAKLTEQMADRQNDHVMKSGPGQSSKYVN